MGDSIIRNEEQAWQQFSQYLTDTFKTQYAGQQNILNFLNTTLTKMVTQPQGFSPAALSAMRGGAVDSVAKQFENATKSVQATEADNGSLGGEVMSGVNKQIAGQLAGGRAAATAGELNDIALQNEQQKIQNQRFGVQGLLGTAGEMNPLGYSGQATNAAGTTGELGSRYFGTDQSGFFDKLGSSFASGLGDVLSGKALSPLGA